jgi:DNA-directed RNA polymerase specialized sigma24 family protein
LLAWFSPDRDVAARQYETIRTGLIRIFVSNRCSDAEKLADEALDRAARRTSEIASTYEGEPARYCYGIARNLIHEDRRRKEIATEVVPESPVVLISHDDAYECLLECLEFLTFEKQELILDYHLFQGKAKIEHHRQMAVELSISEGALRTRAHHIRVSLEKCILQCMSGVSSKQKQQFTT